MENQHKLKKSPSMKNLMGFAAPILRKAEETRFSGQAKSPLEQTRVIDLQRKQNKKRN